MLLSSSGSIRLLVLFQLVITLFYILVSFGGVNLVLPPFLYIRRITFSTDFPIVRRATVEKKTGVQPLLAACACVEENYEFPSA